MGGDAVHDESGTERQTAACARTSGFAERSTRHSSVAVERSLLESFAALIHAQGQVRAQEPLP